MLCTTPKSGGDRERRVRSWPLARPPPIAEIVRDPRNAPPKPPRHQYSDELLPDGPEGTRRSSAIGQPSHQAWPASSVAGSNAAAAIEVADSFHGFTRSYTKLSDLDCDDVLSTALRAWAPPQTQRFEHPMHRRSKSVTTIAALHQHYRMLTQTQWYHDQQLQQQQQQQQQEQQQQQKQQEQQEQPAEQQQKQQEQPAEQQQQQQQQQQTTALDERLLTVNGSAYRYGLSCSPRFNHSDHNNDNSNNTTEYDSKNNDSNNNNNSNNDNNNNNNNNNDYDVTPAEGPDYFDLVPSYPSSAECLGRSGSFERSFATSASTTPGSAAGVPPLSAASSHPNRSFRRLPTPELFESGVGLNSMIEFGAPSKTGRNLRKFFSKLSLTTTTPRDKGDDRPTTATTTTSSAASFSSTSSFWSPANLDISEPVLTGDTRGKDIDWATYFVTETQQQQFGADGCRRPTGHRTVSPSPSVQSDMVPYSLNELSLEQPRRQRRRTRDDSSPKSGYRAGAKILQERLRSLRFSRIFGRQRFRKSEVPTSMQ